MSAEAGPSKSLYLILGDGQLGRMEIPYTKQYGIETATYGPNPKETSPAGRLVDVHYQGLLTDANAIYAAGQDARVISYEIEHLPIEPLIQLKEEGKLVRPFPESLRIIQDKLWQKEAVAALGIPTARFQGVGGKDDIIKAGEALGYPLMLKSRRGGYDGGGNYKVIDIDHIDEGTNNLKAKGELYVEEFIPFVGEAAVSVARDVQGNTKMYPVVETYHEDNICHSVVYPARFNKGIIKQGEEIGRRAIGLIEGPGLLAVEMFVTEDGRVLYNEAAPRPHNSLHLSRKASRTSQFEQHMRAVNDMPLGSTEMTVYAAAMVNILGRGTTAPSSDTVLAGVADVMNDPALEAMLYGKDWRVNRKLGDVVATSPFGATHALSLARNGRERIAL